MHSEGVVFFLTFLDTTLTPLHSRPCIWISYSKSRLLLLLILAAGSLEHGLVVSGTSVEERSLGLEEACVFVELLFLYIF